MSDGHAINSLRADVRQLEVSAACARQAFVCAYSSSSEFEAATIAERRAAGAYGSWLRPLTALTISAIVAGIVLLLAAFSQV
jgi:hypothetical protein